MKNNQTAQPVAQVYTKKERLINTVLFLVALEIPVGTVILLVLSIFYKRGISDKMLAVVSEHQLYVLFAVAFYGVITTPIRLYKLWNFAAGKKPGRAFFHYLLLFVSLGIPSVFVIGGNSFSTDGLSLKEIFLASLPAILILNWVFDAYRRAKIENSSQLTSASQDVHVQNQFSQTLAVAPNKKLIEIVEVSQCNDSNIQTKVNQTHRIKIQELELLRFSPLCTTEEKVSPIALLLIPTLIIVLFKEVSKLDFGLKLHAYNPLFLNKDSLTLASITKISVNFYTFFTDGTALKTSNTGSVQPESNKNGALQQFGSKDLSECYNKHLSRVEQLKQTNKICLESGVQEKFFEYSKNQFGIKELFYNGIPLWCAIIYLSSIYIF